MIQPQDRGGAAGAFFNSLLGEPRCCGNEPPFAHRAPFWFLVQIDFEFLGFKLLRLLGLRHWCAARNLRVPWRFVPKGTRELPWACAGPVRHRNP